MGTSQGEAIIEPRTGWQTVDFKELWEYRDLFYFLVWRDIKVLYAQTILGFAWAILQPLIQIIIFTIVFGKVAKVDTAGIPYFLFSTVSIIPWTYISQSVQASSQSLVTGQGMLGKIYFPRLIYPLTPILAKLVDFGISMLIFIVVSIVYRVYPTWQLLFLPLFFFLMVSFSAGIGMWFSALAIRYRDVRFAMTFVVRMVMYTAPIVYSIESIPMKYRFYYCLNPVVSIIEGFRASLLGNPIPWAYVWPGAITTVLVLTAGMMYFKRMEYIFVDVI
jgi:lipopolysaccharide transport system permease protein